MRAEINLYNEDCLQAMKAMQDKQFDLAIVDPPYGIGLDGEISIRKPDRPSTWNKEDKYTRKDWDKETPSAEYWTELFRISKNQIVWGGNYFPYLWENGCKGFVFWYKHQPIENWASGELAWTSFDKPAKCFDYMCYGGVNQDKNRFHPTQKPVDLYKWILDKYANKGDKIIDTHLGSGSIAVACWDMGYDLTGYEISKTYYDKACKLFEQHSKQMQLW